MQLMTGQTWGVNGAFGVYLAYYIDTRSFPGAIPLDYAFVGGLAIPMTSFISPVVMKFQRRFGLTPTLFTGAALEIIALISASFATRVWQLYLCEGILFGFGSGFIFTGGSGIVPQWFTRRRAFANTIASSGSGMGGMIWCLATGAMIKNLGLSWSFRITAIVAFTVNVICALLMKDRNKNINPNQRAFAFALFKNSEFNFLLVWGFFSVLGYTILLFSLPNFARRIGLSADQAAIVGAMVHLGMAIGRPIIGFYSSSVGGINMATGATLFGALVCYFVWTFADSYGVLILTAILGGSVCGTFWATIPPLLSDAIGIKELPSGLSVVWCAIVIPGLFAEPIALTLQDNVRISPKSVQIFTGSMFLAGALSLLCVRHLKVARKTLGDSGDNSGFEMVPGSETPRKSTSKRLVGGYLRTTFAWGKY